MILETDGLSKGKDLKFSSGLQIQQWRPYPLLRGIIYNQYLACMEEINQLLGSLEDGDHSETPKEVIVSQLYQAMINVTLLERDLRFYYSKKLPRCEELKRIIFKIIEPRHSSWYNLLPICTPCPSPTNTPSNAPTSAPTLLLRTPIGR